MDEFEQQIREQLKFHNDVYKSTERTDVKLVAIANISAFETTLSIYNKLKGGEVWKIILPLDLLSVLVYN